MGYYLQPTTTAKATITTTGLTPAGAYAAGLITFK
jgi:hypothetical protein